MNSKAQPTEPLGYSQRPVRKSQQLCDHTLKRQKEGAQVNNLMYLKALGKQEINPGLHGFTAKFFQTSRKKINKYNTSTKLIL